MFSRISNGLKGVGILMPKLRKLIKPQKYYQIQRIRVFSSSFDADGVKQHEQDTDLLFDLGGTKVGNVDKGCGRKTKVNNSIKNEPMKLKDKLLVVEPKQAAKKIEVPKEKKKRSFEQLKYHDISLNLTYVKLPFEHPQFSALMLMLKSRKYRAKEDLLLIEGKRLTLDAIDAGLKIRYLLFSNVKQVEEVRNNLVKAFTKDATIIRVPHNDLSFWSTLTTCPGLITVFEKPKDMHAVWRKVKGSLYTFADKNGEQMSENKEGKPTNQILTDLPITLICDQIREPNNLGAIIRTCAALPCSKIILLKGCTDPWDVKALRGGCGSQFRIPIIGPIEWDEVGQHLPSARELSVFVADTKVESPIPVAGPWDDFEHSRKQNNIKYFNAKPYSSIAFADCKNIVLIVGGETEGVSSHAIDFMQSVSKQSLERTTDAPDDQCNESDANNKIGHRLPENSIVRIPLGNGIDSLNATIATSVLLFEMRKQLIGQ